MEQDNIFQKYEMIKSSMNQLDELDEGELYLLIIGVNLYKKETNLRFPKKESEKFLNIFSNYDKLKKKNIYSYFDVNATKYNILTQIDSFKTLLSKKDKLVIYFSGHGHCTNYANFFVPYDGTKDNFTSCIPNSLIANSIMNLPSTSILLFYDLKFSESHFKSYCDAYDNKFFSSHKQNYKILGDTYFDRFMNFFSESRKNRVKEGFCFIKQDQPKKTNLAISYDWNFQFKLENELFEKYQYLHRLMNERKTEFVLNSLSSIVENNDADLFGRIETLKYKLKQVKNTASDEKREDLQTIDQITCEVIERIRQNGFYVIKTPREIEDAMDRSKKRMKILFTSANPRDEDFLRLNSEAKEIEYELMKAKYRDDFEFIHIKSLDINELQNRLLNDPPQFLHFSGHGNCDGIALLDNCDNVEIIKNEPLAKLFKLFSNEIECIFLNSCHSIKQSEEISKYINKVICMKKEVPDELAIFFATAFYKSIGAGKTIDFSFDFAKNAIQLKGLTGSDIPILLPN